MNEIRVRIYFTDGTEELVDCCGFDTKNGLLHLCVRFQNDLYYPLENIKKYIVD